MRRVSPLLCLASSLLFILFANQIPPNDGLELAQAIEVDGIEDWFFGAGASEADAASVRVSNVTTALARSETCDREEYQ